MKLSLRLFVVCIFTLLTIGFAQAADKKQPTPGEKAFKFRTSLLQTFSWKFGQMVGAMKQEDETAFSKHQSDLVYLSSMLEEGFKIKDNIPEGSDAKPEIWEDYDGFKEKAAALTSLTKELKMADFNPRDFGSKACGGCHRDFRVKRE